MRMKCLILGGGGFLGGNLVGELLKNGYEVTVFEKKGFSRSNIVEYLEDITLIEGDFQDRSKIKELIKDNEYLFHLISTTVPSSSQLNFQYDIESNLLTTLNILELVKQSQIKKIVFISSGGTVYGIPKNIPISENDPTNPINSYGIVKKTIEDYLKLFRSSTNIEICIFRLSNPYGEKQNPYGTQGVIPVFMQKAINEQVIEVWGDGTIIRDYIYVSDVVKILAKSLTIQTPELIYNLGSGKGTSLNQIIELIQKEISTKIKIKYLEARNFDTPVNVLNVDRLKKRFQYTQFIEIDQGVNLLYKFLTKK